MATLIAIAGAIGVAPVVGVVLLVQLMVVGGLLLLVDAPARSISVAVAALGAVAADLLALRDSGDRVGDLVAVVGVAVVASVAVELFRRERSRVVVSLSATISAVVLVVLAAHAVALSAAERGDAAMPAGYAAVAVALLTALGLRAVRQPGWLAVCAGAAAGAVVGAVFGALGDLTPRTGAAIGLAGGLAGAVALTTFDAAVHPLGPRRRRLARPLGAALPAVLAAPAVFAVSLLLVG